MSNAPFVVTLSVFLLAACGGGSGARRIANGKEVAFRGVAFDLPANWRSEQRAEGLVLQPEGANASGMLEEMYLLGADPAVRSLDGDAAEQSIAASVQQMQPDAEKKRGPDAATFGGIPGRTWIFTATTEDGRTVEVRAHAFMGQSGCALFALGFPDVLQRRAADLQAILGSLRAQATPVNGAGTKGAGGAVAEELAGQWIWMTNLSANSGGTQTNTWIQLQADGRYQWHHDSVSSNPNGAAWGSEDESGVWSMAGDTITFRPDGGAPYSQQLVKQNHPQNGNDPMIVLDGKAYVTATPRRPW